MIDRLAADTTAKKIDPDTSECNALAPHGSGVAIDDRIRGVQFTSPKHVLKIRSKLMRETPYSNRTQLLQAFPPVKLQRLSQASRQNHTAHMVGWTRSHDMEMGSYC